MGRNSRDNCETGFYWGTWRYNDGDRLFLQLAQKKRLGDAIGSVQSGINQTIDIKECQWTFLQRGLENERKGVSQRVEKTLGGLGSCEANVRSVSLHEPRRDEET